MNRRQFIASSLAASLAPRCMEIAAAGTAAGRRPRILLRSSWQTVNIGDIAHTPGVLKLLETYLPNAEIHLWPSKLDNGVDKLLLARFPNLKIAQSTAALDTAFESCDFLLHGSGASLVAEQDVVRWHEQTRKPYGIYGITLPPKKSSSTVAVSRATLVKTIEVLSNAKFVFFRDSKSLRFAKEQGCSCPLMEFGPDGAFACDLRDDVNAEAFLSQHRLEPGKFLCCIPRLRYTPYWTIPSKRRPFDAVKHARNESMKEHDHAPLRRAIIEVVRQTDLKVLLCPEDQTQMLIGKQLLLDKLPRNIRHRVVWRPKYWLTGEAISTYIRSGGLFGNEMHSPILCVGHGIPAIVCRWAEQTTKGYMWADIGLGDWLFDLDDESDVARIVPTVLTLARDLESAKAKAERAQRFVQERQRATMAYLASELA